MGEVRCDTLYSGQARSGFQFSRGSKQKQEEDNRRKTFLYTPLYSGQWCGKIKGVAIKKTTKLTTGNPPSRSRGDKTKNDTESAYLPS